MSELRLRIGWKMLINDLLDLHPLEHRDNHGQAAECRADNIDLTAIGNAHANSLHGLGKMRKPNLMSILKGAENGVKRRICCFAWMAHTLT